MNASMIARCGGLLRSLSGGLSSGRLSASALGGCRTLFVPTAIGIDGYEKQRERTAIQFSGMGDKFRDKMKEFASGDAKNMIFTEDLKNMLFLAENKPEDLDLVVQMMRRFNSQNKHLRFGNYVFGPVVMRMYHFLNQPQQALEVFKDPELEGFFDQLSTYQILCDLLYNNQMYQEVLDVFELVKGRQTQGAKFPRNVVILVFASCYKMNTLQSYEYALSVLQEMKTVGSEPVRRVVSFAAALALAQNAPNVALEILSLSGISNYVTIRNLKIQALAELGRPDDVLPILRQSMEFDNPTGEKRSSVFSDVLEKVSTAIEKLQNKEVAAEFESIVKSLKETNQISTDSISIMIESEITPPLRLDQGQGIPRQNQQQRGLRIGQSIDMRARRNPSFEKDFRDRRGIMTE